jgi:iron complex outermembrane recepter protein
MKLTLQNVTTLIAILIGFTAAAQTGSIKGKILTIKAEELIGASVVIQNTTFGTSTDNEGNFQISNVPVGKYIIVVSSIGFTASSKEVEVLAGKELYLKLEMEEDQTTLSEVTVIGNNDRGYNASSSAVGTRLNVPLLETPQSIQVVSYQIIRDQQALSVNDAMKNIAGVQNIAPGYSYYTFRGFDSFNNGPGIITNGIRGVNYTFFQTASLFNIDKIEAIKGPASALYSVGNLGGIINMTTKKPLSTNQYELNTTVDNFGEYRFIADATGPLDKDKKILYRLIAGYNGGSTFRDNIKLNYFFIAPSLTFNFSENTSLNVELNQVLDNTNIRGDRGIVAIPQANGTFDFDAVPLSWNRTSENDKGKITSTLVQAAFRHRFSDRLSFTALHSYGISKNENESYSYDFGGNFNASNDSLVGRSWVKGPFGNESFNLNYFLNYSATTGSIKHDLVFGADYGTASSYDRSVAYAAPGLAIANPVNTGNPSTFPLQYSLDINNATTIYGVYVQDLISFNSKLKALLGLRYDGSVGKDDTSFDTNTSPNFKFENSFNSLLPRFGLVYLPTKDVSLYGSYTTSYNPSLGDPSFGANAVKDYEPEGGVQYEVGVKAELLKKKLIPTLAVYHLTKTNVLQNDPNDPTFRRFITLGEVLSKGIELTLQGNISEALSITSFYAYNDVRITKDVSEANIGNRLGNAPYHSANVWVKYNLIQGSLNGLGIGAGFDFASSKVSQFSQDFEIPSYSNFDALINYGFKNYRLALNVYNVFDTRQIRGGYQPSVIFPGQPRTYRFSLNIKF